MGRYAQLHGVSAAAKHFSKKFGGMKLRESTVRSICYAYKVELGCMQKRPAGNGDDDDNGEVYSLPPRKRGRKVILGADIDCKVQSYLRKVRDGGGVELPLQLPQVFCLEFGGPIELNRGWAYSLL